MKLYNTHTRELQELPEASKQKTITLYTCGPTVYDHTHIGHMRKFVMDDILRRTLIYLGHDVKHVMNITDVGHLTGDDDTGEDKIEKRAKTIEDVKKITEMYTWEFVETMKALNVELPKLKKAPSGPIPQSGFVKATDHVAQMIEIVKKLEKHGLTYETEQAIYFDVTKFRNYGQLSRQKLEEKKSAAREDVYTDLSKLHPADFALWFKRSGRFANHIQYWKSPWGDGFPGWHIECSAMSMAYLGETIDIHTGGIDHIPVHHENEIAQSEGTTGKQFVKIWVHHAFLKVNDEKMSKSKNNFYTIQDVLDHEINPIALRYLFLQTHYRQELNFTWEAAQGAQNALLKLWERAQIFSGYPNFDIESARKPSSPVQKGINDINDAIQNDLNLPRAIGILHDTLGNVQTDNDELFLFSTMDLVLGLKFKEKGLETLPISEKIKLLAEERFLEKQKGNFQKSDELRKQIEEKGYVIEDSTDGYRIRKK